MITFITLAIYIIGVWAAHYQLLRWSDTEITSTDECQILFTWSMLSWLIYPSYGILWLIKSFKEEY